MFMTFEGHVVSLVRLVWQVNWLAQVLKLARTVALLEYFQVFGLTKLFPDGQREHSSLSTDAF